ncbi:hypothetical protein BCR44DRAFT_1453084 [Catenaria anguillulae PL171]|uniref:Uncharacterized protein n=1 Tax=Catenaria anguillulae PL171 TaxID=765915 RepID=A0A1Y2H405_9FUNG|nr:hypothetical protein BCR44DRAFT_1453084 [Catenaria anguillulae PL171]
MVKCGDDCLVIGDLFLPVDSTFPYSVMLLMGEHNHPPPPPEKTPTNIKQAIAEAAKSQQPSHFNKLTSRERLAALAMIHRIDISHPSFAQRQRARNLVPVQSTTPPEVHGLPDQIALFQLFCSGSTLVAGYLQNVSFDGQRFIAFAMPESGAMLLARARVFDIDMTFQCTRGAVNMVKIVVYDTVTNAATTVARAWVDRQEADTYCAIILALFAAYKQHTGQPLHFSAFDCVHNTSAPLAKVGKGLVVPIDAIQLDLDTGQALGVGQALLSVCPAFGMPELALSHVGVPCHVHFIRNVLKSGLSSYGRKLLLSLPTKQADKAEAIVGKYSQVLVRSLFPGYSNIPQHIMASVCPHTNTIESTNEQDHKEVGIHLSLTEYVILAKKFDNEDHQRVASSASSGVPLMFGLSRSASDAANEQRQAKSAKKARAKLLESVKASTSSLPAPPNARAKRSQTSAFTPSNASDPSDTKKKRKTSLPTSTSSSVPARTQPSPTTSVPPKALTEDLLAYYAAMSKEDISQQVLTTEQLLSQLLSVKAYRKAKADAPADCNFNIAGVLFLSAAPPYTMSF